MFGPDIHLGPSQDTDVENDDDKLDEQEEELPKGATADPDTAPPTFPESGSMEFSKLQQATESSIQTVADDGEDLSAVPVEPTKSTNQPQAHSLDQPPKGVKRKAALVKGAAKRKAASQVVDLNEAVPVCPTSKATLPYTGVNQDHISGCVQSSGQSIYRCLFNRDTTIRLPRGPKS